MSPRYTAITSLSPNEGIGTDRVAGMLLVKPRLCRSTQLPADGPEDGLYENVTTPEMGDGPNAAWNDDHVPNGVVAAVDRVSVTVDGILFTVSANTLVTLAVQSLSRTVNDAVPAAVGVPDSRPPELNVSPAGNAPALVVQVKGVVPPVMVSCWLYAVAI